MDVIFHYPVFNRFYCDGAFLSQQIGCGDLTKPAIWIDAGMHAREWIAPATALHIINKVCLHSSTLG